MMMMMHRSLPLLALAFAAACSQDSASPSEAESSASVGATDEVPRIATWAGRPPGRLALARGRLAVVENCLTLEGENGARAIALPRDGVSWDARKGALVMAGTTYSVGQMVAAAGGSIDLAKALGDPAFELNGCTSGSLIFVVERIYGQPPTD